MVQISAKRFIFSSDEFIKNPYPIYDELRSINPVYFMDSFKYSGWYITGYEEVAAILKDSTFKNRIPLPQTTKKYEYLKTIQNNMMLFKNQQDHRRLRSMVSKEFTPRMIENYRTYAEEVVHDLLDQFQNKGKMDVVKDFSFPLASSIIAKLLGVPKEDHEQFREWALTLVPTIDFTRSRKTLEDGNIKTRRLIDYFKALIKTRKENPEQDLISKLILGQQKDELITDEELFATCILLVIAGHETTVNLISNSILSLITHPNQLVKLTENPSFVEHAVEEFLRYESPTQMIARVAADDTVINEKTIRKGEQVYLMLGAANRDPKKFVNPEKLDITRSPNPHLAFGYGAHFCIGSQLARLEAQVAIQSILQRFTDLQLATSTVQWRSLVGFRALNELEISFRCI